MKRPGVLLVVGLLIALAVGFSPAGQAAPAAPGTAVSPPRLADGSSFLVNDDYPAEALRLRQEGTTQVSLQIDGKGKVADCRLLESSGSPSLDEATCRILAKLRFKPARDDEGHAEVGAFVRKMNWKLPGR